MSVNNNCSASQSKLCILINYIRKMCVIACCKFTCKTQSKQNNKLIKNDKPALSFTFDVEYIMLNADAI